MELTHQDNTAEAADPPAIVTGTFIPKAPLWNNDPTRDVTHRQRWARALALTLATAALVALVFALDDRARAVLGDGTDPLLTTTRRLKVLVIAQLLLGLSAYVGKLAAPVAATAPWPVVLLTMAHQVLGATLLAGSVVAAAFATRRLAEAVTLRPPMADHSSSAPLPGSAT